MFADLDRDIAHWQSIQPEIILQNQILFEFHYL